MGIDVYMMWDNMTKEDKEKQYTGFSIVHGHVGYLREAYHGKPYATMALITEDWEKPNSERVVVSNACEDNEVEDKYQGFEIPNSTLQERLPHVIEVIKERHKKLYDDILTEDSPEVKSFVDFVALHKEKEEKGLRPFIYISY